MLYAFVVFALSLDSEGVCWFTSIFVGNATLLVARKFFCDSGPYLLLVPFGSWNKALVLNLNS